MAKPTQPRRTHSTPPAGKTAADASTAAAVDPAGALPSPAGGGEERVKAGTAASSEAAGTLQPAGDPVPPPVAGIAHPPVVLGIDALFAQPEAAERAIVSVTAPIGARRRDGRKFGPRPTLIPLAELGEAGLRAIDADPALAWALVGQLENADDDA